MKRKVKFSAVLLTAAMLLTACNEQGEPVSTADTSGNVQNSQGSQDSPNTDSTESLNTNTAESSSLEEDPTLITDKSKFPTDLYGLNGDKIDIDEITEVHKQEGGSDDEWWSAGCSGFVYLAEPTGINYNSLDNADSFNSEDNSFEGSPEESPAEYKRYKGGDEICGLTVANTFVYFANKTDDYPEPFEGQHFCGGSVSFEGEKKLTGYIIILSEELYGIGGTGDVIFIPDKDSQTLPVMNYNAADAEKGIYSNVLSFAVTVGGFSYKNEYRHISCGNIDSYESSWFLGEEHNKPVKVSVTLTDLSISSSIDWITSYTANIKEISF
ncbi:MAG: hypothetical protein K2N36_07250 [Ruminiclostridium sp.]|nr:hypothetical protein [Ruminiclostridium sp.]